MIREAASPQLILDFEKPDEERLAGQLRAFIAQDKLDKLPSRYRKALEHAVMLFHFHEQKEAASFAPVFQPMLGPIDHAAESLLLGHLFDDVPAEATAQKDFFEPDMSGAKKKNVKFLSEKASLLKRLLVHRSPVMPTGILIFCLNYAARDTLPLPGIFTSVRSRLSDLAATGLKDLLEQFYDFRNTYIAHQKEELAAAGQAKKALQTWSDTLVSLRLAIEAHAVVASAPT